MKIKKTAKTAVAETPAPAATPVKAKKAAKVAAVVAETKAKAGEVKTPKPSINKGRTTGMRVMQYQDHSLTLQPKRKLSDEELAADWQGEFPNARCRFNANIVAGVRRLFNEGKHGNQQTVAPDGGVSRYEAGKPVAERKRGEGKKAEAA